MTPSIVVIFMDLVLHMCRMAQDMKVLQVIKTITLHPLWTILIRHQQTHRAISAFYCILQSASRTRKWQHFHGSNTLWQLEMEERVNILNPNLEALPFICLQSQILNLSTCSAR